MVNSSSAALDATFGALADPTRRAIVAQLSRRPEASVGDLARPFDVSLPAISRHLRVLERAGLIARQRDGRVHRCRLVPAPMETAAEWIERHRKFWEGRLDALARFLESGEEREEVESWKRGKGRRRRGRTGSRSRDGSGPRGSGSSARGRSPS